MHQLKPLNYPRLIAFDLDGTLWVGHLNKNWIENQSLPAIEDNLECKDGRTVKDSSGTRCSVKFSAHAAEVIQESLANGVQLAVVSRNTSKALCDRAMWMLQIDHPTTKQQVPFTDCIEYDEVEDGMFWTTLSLLLSFSIRLHVTVEKDTLFVKIHNWSGIDYREMLFFDDEFRNATVESVHGVTFMPVSHSTGITKKVFNSGLDVWRRNQSLRVSIPSGPSRNPNYMLVGYLGTDADTASLYEKGMRRPKSDRPSRWGWATYMTDDPQIAKFFAMWMRGEVPRDKERICRIYARDKDMFLKTLKKVWVDIQLAKPWLTDNVHHLGDEQYIMGHEFKRDRHIKSTYNIDKPYVLFCKHHYMKEMKGHGIKEGEWFNELVIYPQIQDALFVGESYALDNPQVDHWSHLHYDHKGKEWGITWPLKTKAGH